MSLGRTSGNTVGGAFIPVPVPEPTWMIGKVRGENGLTAGTKKTVQVQYEVQKYCT